MTECDEWEGWICSSTGYGQLKIAGRKHGAHRIVMMQEVGHLEPNEFVCHSCDNRKCVNIDHLFVGSHTDNARDMCAKGRQHQQVKKKCPSGHPYDTENTAVLNRKGGGVYRKCRACDRKRHMKAYYKKKEQSA